MTTATKLICTLAITGTMLSLVSCGGKSDSDNKISLPDKYDWGSNVQTFTTTQDSSGNPDETMVYKEYTAEELEAFHELQSDPNNDANIVINEVNELMEKPEFLSMEREAQASAIMDILNKHAEQSDNVGKLKADYVSYDDTIELFTFTGVDGSYGEIDLSNVEYGLSNEENDTSTNDNDGGWVR